MSSEAKRHDTTTWTPTAVPGALDLLTSMRLSSTSIDETGFFTARFRRDSRRFLTCSAAACGRGARGMERRGEALATLRPGSAAQHHRNSREGPPVPHATRRDLNPSTKPTADHEWRLYCWMRSPSALATCTHVDYRPFSDFCIQALPQECGYLLRVHIAGFRDGAQANGVFGRRESCTSSSHTALGVIEIVNHSIVRSLDHWEKTTGTASLRYSGGVGASPSKCKPCLAASSTC